MENRKLAYGFELGDSLGGSPEVDVALCSEVGQSLEELEDTGFTRLHFSEGLQIHEQVDDLLILRCRGDPVHVFVGCEGICVPVGIGEAEGNVVGQLGVLQQNLELGSACGAVNVVGRFPSEDVLGTFGNHAFVAHIENHRCHFVAIYELGVAEHFGANSEEIVDLVVVHLHLGHEFLGIRKRAERVCIGLGQEFNAAGGSEFFQQVDELGHVELELFQGSAGDGECATEVGILLYHAQQAFCGGNITAVGYAGDDVVVGEIIIVVVVIADVEEAIAF